MGHISWQPRDPRSTSPYLATYVADNTDMDLRTPDDDGEELEASSTPEVAVRLPESQPVLGEVRWREIALHLYTQLDDIDTLYDACKGDEHAFYVHVARHHPRRHEVADTDGYRVIFR